MEQISESIPDSTIPVEIAAKSSKGWVSLIGPPDYSLDFISPSKQVEKIRRALEDIYDDVKREWQNCIALQFLGKVPNLSQMQKNLLTDAVFQLPTRHFLQSWKDKVSAHWETFIISLTSFRLLLTMKDLLSWVSTNLIKERLEMFMTGESVGPGVLVLVNDCDWELSGQLDTTLEEKDVVVFISTLHGG
ncbi:hypothetical protein CCACVL1_15959 [Corchorus capsularis]|uniref:Ubiquitin-related modifier 1 homolog n=1 Tax=Corchorus capsularis TaxID=210143 RepID=A0A1R3I066_COCAP|nr:hypothetical protein CCACVL1_15959 [Corchorus capsularis]